MPDGSTGRIAVRWLTCGVSQLRTATKWPTQQIMPDIPQPWRFLSVYDFDLPAPEIDIPALGPLIAERATPA